MIARRAPQYGYAKLTLGALACSALLVFSSCSHSKGSSTVGVRPTSADQAAAGSTKTDPQAEEQLSFTCSEIIELQGTKALSLSDMDSNGKLDLILLSDRLLLVLAGDGAGAFDTNRPLSEIELGPGASDMATGDIDRDGDPDVVVAVAGLSAASLHGSGGPNLVYFNERGGLVDSGQRLGRDTTNAVVLLDIDGDGFLDLVSGNTGKNRVRLNEGTGFFSPVLQSLGREQTLALVCGDFNGDGSADVISGNAGVTALRGIPEPQPDRVWLRGNPYPLLAPNIFFFSDRGFGTSNTRALAAADMDGDGDLDVLAGSEDGVEIWLNDGEAFFDYAGGWNDGPVFSIVVEDLDLDGDPDVVSAGPAGVVLRENLGDFVFAPLLLSEQPAFDLSTGDINGDGFPDLAAAAEQGAALYLNSGR